MKPTIFTIVLSSLIALFLEACATSSQSEQPVRFHFFTDRVDKPFQSIDTLRSEFLLGKSNGALDSLELSSVERIVVVKESHAAAGLALGFLGGYILGYIASEDPPEPRGWAVIVPQLSRADKALLAGLGAGALGLLVGAATGIDITYDVSKFTVATKIALVQSLMRQESLRKK